MLLDRLLQPLFGAGQPEHVGHLTWFTAESFGGPDRFTRELEFEHLIDVHRHLAITALGTLMFEIDEIVAPGADIGRLDQDYVPPGLQNPNLLRRPLEERAAA